MWWYVLGAESRFHSNVEAGISGLGYLVGPAIGSSLWRLTHRRLLTQIEARDREFHRHIVKNRVDPTAQSATNPVPDFYGQNILLSLVFNECSLSSVRRKNWFLTPISAMAEGPG